VTYEGHSIADILEMTVDQALGLFENRLEVLRALEPLHRMGLGYLTLGQPLSTLSGGEAQRLKLARFLARCEERTLFLLDEPTTGMHLDDVRILVQVLMDLVEEGHSVVVIEHHLDVIKCADHVIDLGPEGGDAGGRLVVQGTPEEIATHPESHTGRYLRAHLEAAAGPRFPLAGSESPLAEALPYTGNNDIRIIGAREHNLKDLHVHLPRGKLIAVSGVSGSGKSTLAFDILFAEGQRRYLESLPAYVRQYLKVLDRPEVDLVAGVPPTVAIEQRSARGGRRSTVATLSEIYHFLRLLYARLGRQYCPRCDIPITRGRVEEMIRTTVDQLSGRTVTILAPKVMGRKGFHHRVFAQARRRGIERVRVDGDLMPLAQVPRLDRYREHWIDWVVTDGLIASPDRLEALQGAFEKGLKESDGTLIVTGSGGQELTFSRRRQCPGCGLGFEELDPRHFSFNSPMGACERCEGLGTVTLGDAEVVCPDCGGSRLIAKARAVRVLGLTLPEATAVNISRSLAFWSAAEFPELWRSVAQPVVADIVSRLQTLKILGLGYLTLDRAGNTLSGGEAQRIRLASQIGSNLQGVCYVLDEPTIGLHPRDNERLIGSLQSLRDRGNTVVVVEHDEKVIQRADWIVELGPGPGREGGRLVAQGKWADLQRDASSPTALALADQGHRRTTSRARPAREDKWIRIKGAVQHNLKQIDVELPLGTLICVTGVSGSGKSSLVEDVLFRGLRRHLVGDPTPVGRHERIEGWQNIEKVLKVDHAPIGRTPRSTPATYVKIWDEVRKLFAGLPESKSRGYGPGRVSFNVACGRCPVCRGQGVIKQEMSFLPDVYTTCEACDGLRFNPETLAVTYRRRSAGEVLRMTVDEAADFFTSIPNLLRPLKVLRDLGLGYLTLGQSSPSLSGGEAQRIKLAVELSKNTRGKTLYMLDEPTTGLHLQDVQRLLEVLHRFVGRGDTVVIVEHHLDVIAAADWIVDLGPEGGELGGRLVFQGSPGEILALRDRSHTGKWLARFLGNQSGE
jgi:excinuclease ABC subunit A